MKFFKQLLYALCSLLLWCGSAAVSEAVEVDYNRPKKYIVGGVRVEGVHYFNANQIIQVAGEYETVKALSDYLAGVQG